MGSKRKVVQVGRAVASLYDRNVCGPEALEVAEHPTDAQLRQWWDRTKVYTQAMCSLDRVTMLCYVPDELKFYLASVEESDHAS